MAPRRLAHGCAALAVLVTLLATAASSSAVTDIKTVAGGGTQAIIDGAVPINQFATDVVVNNPTGLAYMNLDGSNIWMALRRGDTSGSDPCVIDESFITPLADIGHYTIVGGQANECSPPASAYGPTLSSVMRFAHPQAIAPWYNNNAPAALIASTDIGRVEMLYFNDSSGFTMAGSTSPASCATGSPPAAPDAVAPLSAQFCKIVALAGTYNGSVYAIGERGREAAATDRGHIYYVSGGSVKHISGSYHVAGLAFASNGDLLVADGLGAVLRIASPGSTPQVTTLGGFYNPSTDTYFTGFMDSSPDSFNASRFNHPVALTEGYDGAVYVADSLNCRIRKIAPLAGPPDDPMIGENVVTTIAGQSCAAPAAPPYGDGGPSDQAQLDTPSGITMTPFGLLVSDTGHDRVRMIDRTSIRSAPPAATNDSSPEFEFASLDTPADFKCTIDDGSTVSCPTPYTLDPLQDGSHTLKVWENNTPKDPTPATATFTVDTVAPDSLFLESPAADATDPAPKPSFSWSEAQDATSGVDHYELWIDDAKDSDVPLSACTGGVCTAQPANALAEAATPHKWQVRAVDKAGNVAQSEERNLNTGGPPAASLLVNPNPALVGRTVTFDGSASSDPSGIAKYEWDLDGDGKFERDTGGTATTTRSFDAPASVPVSLRVTDATGKTSKTTTTLKITAPGSIANLLGISVNSGAQFTNDPNVKLLVKAPVTATSILVSNDGGFLAPSAFPVAQQIDWKLDSSGPERLPKTVYARFMLGPIISETYTDDIILDEIPPVVQQAALDVPSKLPGLKEVVRSAKVRTWTVKVKAKDSNSGVSKVQVTSNKKKPGKLLAYKKKLKVKSAKRPKFLRARDRAGNFSRWKKLR